MDRGAWQATVHGVTESDTIEQEYGLKTPLILGNNLSKGRQSDQRGKKSEALKPRDAPLGPHPTHASASGCGLQDKLHFFHIRNERLTEEKAVSQSQSDHLTSGQRESRWAEISEPGKPSEENSGLEFRRIWEP